MKAAKEGKEGLQRNEGFAEKRGQGTPAETATAQKKVGGTGHDPKTIWL